MREALALRRLSYAVILTAAQGRNVDRTATAPAPRPRQVFNRKSQSGAGHSAERVIRCFSSPASGVQVIFELYKTGNTVCFILPNLRYWTSLPCIRSSSSPGIRLGITRRLRLCVSVGSRKRARPPARRQGNAQSIGCAISTARRSDFSHTRM